MIAFIANILRIFALFGLFFLCGVIEPTEHSLAQPANLQPIISSLHASSEALSGQIIEVVSGYLKDSQILESILKG